MQKLRNGKQIGREMEKGKNKVLAKLHNCNECEKAYLSISGLTNHIRYKHSIHTGDKPYECGECRYKFAQKSTLKTDVLVHSGEEPHRLACPNWSHIFKIVS